MRIRHYWRKHLEEHEPARTRAVACDAAGTVALLSKEPQEALGWFSRFIAFLTTPFKRIGISGWRETGCGGEGSGRPVRDALVRSGRSRRASRAAKRPARRLRLGVPNRPVKADQSDYDGK